MDRADRPRFIFFADPDGLPLELYEVERSWRVACCNLGFPV